MKVPRASGQTETRQGDGHLGMSSCPQGSLNKVVELGGSGGVEQMPLLTRHMCVFLCVCTFVTVRISVMKKGIVCLCKPNHNLCIFVCLSVCEYVRGYV